jgi:N-acetylglucosamine-6-phosphate deacetylase
MDVAVANLVAAGLPLCDAVTAATLTPAWTIGERSRGRLVALAPADLVVLDEDLTCLATIVDGTAVYDAKRLLTGLQS